MHEQQHYKESNYTDRFLYESTFLPPLLNINYIWFHPSFSPSPPPPPPYVSTLSIPVYKLTFCNELMDVTDVNIASNIRCTSQSLYSNCVQRVTNRGLVITSHVPDDDEPLFVVKIQLIIIQDLNFSRLNAIAWRLSSSVRLYCDLLGVV